MKIYTRTGDQGQTGLFGGARVPKNNSRLEAYGTLDELNSLLGIVRLHASEACGAQPALERLQQDLLVLGAKLATPPSEQARLDKQMEHGLWPISAIEDDIDRLTALAPPLRCFVLPGGVPAAAYAHLARTVCRRAERIVVALAHQEHVETEVLCYLNRISDWFFALARAENAIANYTDVLWQP